MKTILTITALPAIAAALVSSSCNNKEDEVTPVETAPATETPTAPLTPPGTSKTDEEKTLKVPESEINTPQGGQ
jgi:hypothetical protein